MTRMLVLAVQNSPDAFWEVGSLQRVNTSSYPRLASQEGYWARDRVTGLIRQKPWWLLTHICGQPLRPTAGNLFDRG